MKKSILLILLSFLITQNPISDQGLDLVVAPGEVVTISGAASYGVDGNGMETESEGQLNTEYESNVIDAIYGMTESLRTTFRGLVDLMGSLSLSLSVDSRSDLTLYRLVCASPHRISPFFDGG